MDATERDMTPQKNQLITPNSRGDILILATPTKTVGFGGETTFLMKITKQTLILSEISTRIKNHCEV